MATNPNPITGLPLSGGTLTGSLTVNGVIATTGVNNMVSPGGFDASLAGVGLSVKEGSNAKQGTVTLSGATTTVVANTSVTANSRIDIFGQSLGTVTVFSTYGVSARTPGTSFTITASQATDTSVVAYEIFEPG